MTDTSPSVPSLDSDSRWNQETDIEATERESQVIIRPKIIQHNVVVTLTISFITFGNDNYIEIDHQTNKNCIIISYENPEC